jgi:hypothetical protein
MREEEAALIKGEWPPIHQLSPQEAKFERRASKAGERFRKRTGSRHDQKLDSSP